MTQVEVHQGSFWQKALPSTLEAVESACGELRQWLATSGARCQVFDLELVARECLNNAVLHGNQSDAMKRVTLRVRLGRRWIRLEVVDEGLGFDWRKVSGTALRDVSLTDGRGLFICRKYGRRVAFQAPGNRIIVWFDLQPLPTRHE